MDYKNQKPPAEGGGARALCDYLLATAECKPRSFYTLIPISSIHYGKT